MPLNLVYHTPKQAAIQTLNYSLRCLIDELNWRERGLSIIVALSWIPHVKAGFPPRFPLSCIKHCDILLVPFYPLVGVVIKIPPPPYFIRNREKEDTRLHDEKSLIVYSVLLLLFFLQQ